MPQDEVLKCASPVLCLAELSQGVRDNTHTAFCVMGNLWAKGRVCGDTDVGGTAIVIMGSKVGILRVAQF